MKKWRKAEKEEASDLQQSLSVASLTSPPQQASTKVFHTGVRLLYEAENSEVDIIFVHGLAGDREETWKMPGASASWPETLLPSKVTNARVLTFGYDASVADWRGMVSKNRIGNHSMNLLAAIATHREDDDTNGRPIIFVCHSLGGLVCEDALSMAQQRPERHLKKILHCTRAIMFLGTPHHGSGLARWAESLAKAIGLLKQTNPNILTVLRSESEVLERLQGSFHTMIRSRAQDGLPPIEITCFYEELPLPGVGRPIPFCDSTWLRSNWDTRNHMDMTKFEDVNDPGFIAVAGELRRWAKELAQPTAPTLVNVSETVHTSGPGPSSMSQPKSFPSNLSMGPQSCSIEAHGGHHDQGVNNNLYRGVPTMSLPKEIAQYLPQSNMGPKERKLLKAAGKGDIEEIRRLVEDGAILSAINEDGESALTRAISRKHHGVAKLLLENDATTDYSGPLVQKPLHIAVQTGNIKMVELLLDHDADIDELTAHGSVLSQAIKAGRDDIALLLLSRDADLNLARYPIHWPLGNAIVAKNEPLIKTLLKRGAETDILLDNLYQITAKQLSESCQALLRDWHAQKYEEHTEIICSRSSDMAEKELAVVTALKCASEQRQPEIHSMFVELAEEFNVARTKEFVYRA